jgi:Exocyst complex component Sec3
VSVNTRAQVTALRERLEAEHAALEGANVHALLDSEAAVPAVLQRIDVAFAKLEDLECTLGVFDGKLSAMRDDIAAIEACNGELEAQAHGLEALRKALTQLLSVLTVRHL